MTPTGEAVGLDGCPGGWIAVHLVEGRVGEVVFLGDVSEVDRRWGRLPLGIDIPIGLVDDPVREADAAARALLPGQASSVFSTPPGAVVEAWRAGSVTTHAQATALAVATTGKGISQQAWRLVDKIAEVDALAATGREHLYEIHPELAFRGLAGERLARKASWSGLMARRTLLAARGITLPDGFPGADRCAPDDVVDAAVVAWTACGAADGAVLQPHPSSSTQRDHDRPVAIWTRP